MKKYFLIIFIIITASCFAQLTGPKLTAKSTHYDFGTVIEGQIVSTSYEITNSGNAELKIEQVRASCGCTAAQPTKTLLKPGEKTSIKVEFNSSGRLGPQEKTVYVIFNDPKDPEFRLTFSCVVVDQNAAKQAGQKLPKLKLLKNEYDFGNVEEGKLVETKIGFKNEGKGTLEISEVKTSCGCTAALLSSKKLNGGESGNVRIELDTANREGKLVRTVTLFSNDPDAPNQIITLHVNITKRKS